MSYLAINGYDVSDKVKSMKIGYETLVADTSGRNANGDTVLDIINRKIKVYVVFRPMKGSEMQQVLSAISGYIVNISFRNAETSSTKTINCYTGTPEPDYYYIHGSDVLFKEMSLNFIEM